MGSSGVLTHQAGPFQGFVGLLTSVSPGQSYGAPLQPQGCVHCSPMAALRGSGGTPGQTSSSKEMLKQGTKVNYCKIFWNSMLRCFEEGLSPSQIIFFFNIFIKSSKCLHFFPGTGTICALTVFDFALSPLH